MATIAVDHLLFAGPELGPLRLRVEELSGLRAMTGGRHENWGTHNALLGLGSGMYLELIAPEPGADGPWGSLFARLQAPSLQAWCVRCGSASRVAARLEALGVATKRVPGGRQLADGRRLTWELVFPTGHEFGGALPFFIDWQDSVHPSQSLEPVAQLEGLTVEHPQAPQLEGLLLSVGELPGEVRIVPAARPALRARLETADGVFELHGELDPNAHLGAV